MGITPDIVAVKKHSDEKSGIGPIYQPHWA
jgi:hypothetical protein